VLSNVDFLTHSALMDLGYVHTQYTLTLASLPVVSLRAATWGPDNHRTTEREHYPPGPGWIYFVVNGTE